MDASTKQAQQRQTDSWIRAAGHCAAPELIERRGAPRSRIIKKGKLIHPNKISVFDCIITDISETGARVSCEQPGVIPNELQLMFFAIRQVRYVRVVWRGSSELGLQFLTPAVPAAHLKV
jgi:hypothetical protein